MTAGEAGNEDGGQLQRLNVVAATPDRWPDIELLFGKNGACGGCWCMWGYGRSKEYSEKIRIAL